MTLTDDQATVITDALETAQHMFSSLDGLEFRYSPEDVRTGHFVREINLLRGALEVVRNRQHGE